jgi:predicted acetyltransferase
MPNVTLEPADRDRRETLANLFQLYTHDFSEQWRDRPNEGELGEDGRFEPYRYLDDCWRDPRREALLIRADAHLAGFVLVNAYSHSGLPADFNMAEFFVVRKHRRVGVGRAAALAAIRARPGLWEIAVARRNTGALAFWRDVAAQAASHAIDERDRADARWNGAILRFVVR